MACGCVLTCVEEDDQLLVLCTKLMDKLGCFRIIVQFCLVELGEGIVIDLAMMIAFAKLRCRTDLLGPIVDDQILLAYTARSQSVYEDSITCLVFCR